MFGSVRHPVGLDLGSHSVKALQLKGSGGTLRAAAVAVEPLEAGAIVDGAIADREAVAEAVQRACARGAFARSVCVALPGSVAIVRRVRIPDVPDADRDEVVRQEAAEQIPFDLDDVHLDYECVPALAEENRDGATEVLVAAARKETVAGYTDAVARAGRLPVVVDLTPFAFQNAYEANYGSRSGELVALLDAGASTVSVNVLHAGQSVFTRDVPAGGNTYTEALRKELGLSPEDAERAKRDGVSPALLEQARPIFRAVTDHILLEVAKTFGVVGAGSRSGSLTRVVLTGGASRVPEFGRMVEDRFGAPVVEFDPFRAIGWDVSSTPDARAELAASMAVAVGLALRRPGDRVSAEARA